MSQTQLTGPASRPNDLSRGLIRRLLTWRSVLVTGSVVTIATVALRAFNWGITILDWADRFEFVRARKGLLFDALAWLLSPVGLNVLLVVAVSITLIAIIVLVRPIKKARDEDTTVMPSLEIVSPFNDEEVGLYETVRGRVFPPDQELQVVIYAPDKKWYPQNHVDVKGELWSVKCQFGQLEGRGGDAFKIAAVLGSQLDPEMWYGNLPDGIKSNAVRVRRQREKTIEQKLANAQNDLVEADKRTEAQRTQKEDILTELRKREADLAELKTLSAIRQGQAENIKDHVIITAVNPIDLTLESNEQSGPCVTFALHIRNESLYNISIRPDEVKGCLAFAEQLLQEPVIPVKDAWLEHIEKLRPLAPASIVLRQPLRGFEVERIKSLPDGRFRLAPLRIPITVVDSQYKILSKNLRITSEFDHLPINVFCNTTSLDSKG